MSAHIFTLPAFAKINLTLRVLGRRVDGFHEIRTVFQTVTLHDRLTFSAQEDDRFDLSCSAPDIPADESNLVYRAAQALRRRSRTRRGARIELEKHIPAGGGLGGGSSDAAIALVGLSHLWELETNARELAEIGAELGADVPFFFTGGTALGTGLGTEITALDDASAEHLLIVTPGERVSTAEAYRALGAPTLTKPESAVMLPVSRVEAQIAGPLHDVMGNDFERVIFPLRPGIARARDTLLELGAHGAGLSGSGSSVYGVFENEETKERAYAALGIETAWQVFRCRTLSRAEYRDAFGTCAAFLQTRS